MPTPRLSLLVLLAILIAGPIHVLTANDTGARNVIIVIVDGGGYQGFDATRYYRHGAADSERFDGPEWIEVGMSTHGSELPRRLLDRFRAGWHGHGHGHKSLPRADQLR